MSRIIETVEETMRGLKAGISPDPAFGDYAPNLNYMESLRGRVKEQLELARGGQSTDCTVQNLCMIILNLINHLEKSNGRSNRKPAQAD